MPDVTVCDILLIENNEDDAFLFQRAFQKSAIPCGVHVARDFPDAKLYLTCKDPYSDRGRFPLPNLIVTDFAVRVSDGVRFIEWFRKQPSLAGIQLICLSAVEDPQILAQISRLAVAIIPKSVLLEDIMSLIRTLVPI